MSVYILKTLAVGKCPTKASPLISLRRLAAHGLLHFFKSKTFCLCPASLCTESVDCNSMQNFGKLA